MVRWALAARTPTPADAARAGGAFRILALGTPATRVARPMPARRRATSAAGVCDGRAQAQFDETYERVTAGRHDMKNLASFLTQMGDLEAAHAKALDKLVVRAARADRPAAATGVP
jgi:hypothetical protein